jgi:hypothetical protein
LGYLFMRSVGNLMADQMAMHLDHILHPGIGPRD